MPLNMPKEIAKEDFFSRLVYARVFTENNVLCIIAGPTGIGKSCAGLKLCETYDSAFNIDNVCFTVEEFMDLVKRLPSRSFVLWDEPGVFVGHRDFYSLSNRIVSIIMQSFRYKFINVFFALPSMFYMDKVAREMCHYLLQMRARGVAEVYAIKKNPLNDWTYTPKIGSLILKLPSKKLLEEYEKKRQAHMDAMFEGLGKQLEVMNKKKDDQIQKALVPRLGIDEWVDKARAILPEITKDAKWIRNDKGQWVPTEKKIDVNALRDKLGVGHNLAYRIRAKLLKELEK